MRVHALRLKAGQAAGVYHVLHTLGKILARAEKAETGHAGIELYVYLQHSAERRRSGGILQRLGIAAHRLGNAVLDEHARILRRRMAENKDRHGYPAAAQLKRLVKAGHGQIVRAAVLQKVRHLHGAVPVGVGLHHAEEAAALRE